MYLSSCLSVIYKNNNYYKISYFISDTPVSEIEDCFKRFTKRDDIDIVLINQNIAELIRHVIDAHVVPVPSVLEIPSKDHPYDASKDSILRRAKVCFCWPIKLPKKYIFLYKFISLGNIKLNQIFCII